MSKSLLYNELKIKLEASNLPPSIKKHLILGIEQDKINRWHETLAKDDFNGFQKIIEATTRCIDMACHSTALDVETLLEWTDFSPNDLGINRLDSALGEIRAINFLTGKNFSVSIQQGKKSSKCTDLILSKDGQDIAFIEVTAMSENSGKTIDDYLDSKWLDKKNQVTSVQNIKYYGLIFIINKENVRALMTGNDFYSLAKNLWEKIGDKKLMIGIVTGLLDGFTGKPDDVLYSDLENDFH